MFKKIQPSDISVRPFKVYKTWDFTSASLDISVLEAEKGTNISEAITFDHHHSVGEVLEHNHLTFNKHALWSQINSQFYNPAIENNPFYVFGSFQNDYNTNIETKSRYLEDYAKVISIPQKFIGEGIKPYSFFIIDNGLKYVDDGKGNLIRAGGFTIIVKELDLNTNAFIFEDLDGNEYTATASITFIDLNAGYCSIVYNSIEYILDLISYDINENRMVLRDISFLGAAATSEKYGNIFYSHGLVVVTKNPEINLIGDWNIQYKSTQTIYENEYLLSTNENEFNVSTNPTAIKVVGRIEEEIEVYDETNPTFKPYKVKTQPYVGTNYIRKLSYDENGEPIDYRYQSNLDTSVKAGFEQYELSGSVDLTGSFLAPYITTIGLYDDDCNLLVVAKLPQPIKSIPDLNINFLVRFDT